MLTDGIRLKDVIRDEGIEVSHRGLFRCPFHDDRHPSARVYPDGHFHCFGCEEHGDAIDFIRKLRGITFKEACAYLWITPQGESVSYRETTEREIKRVLISAFRKWERQYHGQLALLYRMIMKTMKEIRSLEDVERLAPTYQELSLIEYRMDLLIYGSDEVKYRLFQEVSGGRV